MIKRAIRWIAEVVLWLGIFLGLFVLAMGISLAWMRQARAEEIYHLPVAQVMVNKDSHLNIRKAPGGELTVQRVYAYDDVVILARCGDWALIIKPEHVDSTNLNGQPLGWAHMDYLHVYRQHIKKGPWLQPWAGMYPDQFDQQYYTSLEVYWQ